MRYTIVFLSCALAVVSCKSKSKDKAQSKTEIEAKVQSATDVATTSAPERTLEAPDAEGRCDNQTPETPYDALFFYPSRGELFVPSKERSAFRLPIRIRSEKGPNVEFMYKWSDDESKPGSDHPGAATARDGNALAFRFDTLKPSLCEHSDSLEFHAPLASLGMTAGRYLDAEHSEELEILADEQKILLKEKGGKNAIAYYRVKSHDADAVTLFVSNHPPDDSRATVWVEWTLASAGTTLTIDYMGKFTRSYEFQ